MTVEITPEGARSIRLLAPFFVEATAAEVMQQQEPTRLETITLKATMWRHTRRWLAGEYVHQDGMVAALMVDLTGLPMSTLEQLRYPDADRFQDEFMQHIPTVIRDLIASGDYPTPMVDEARRSVGLPIEEEPARRAPDLAPEAETVHYDPDYTPTPASDDDPLPANFDQRAGAFGLEGMT